MVLASNLAYSGRRVIVTGGDLGEAFRRLQTRLRRNRVTQEVSRQKRHEKKGVKRRRLSSERWRRVFANEVFIVLTLHSYGYAHPRAGAEESAAGQHYSSSWSLLRPRAHYIFDCHCNCRPRGRRVFRCFPADVGLHIYIPWRTFFFLFCYYG